LAFETCETAGGRGLSRSSQPAERKVNLQQGLCFQ